MRRGLSILTLHGGPSHDRRSGSRSGWYAWLFQRLTGIGLVGYLFLHIGVISTGRWGDKTFDQVLVFLQTPPFVVMDLILVAVVLFHALNGVRVILFDLGVGIRQQAALFWSALILTAAASGVATYFSWPLIFRE